MKQMTYFISLSSESGTLCWCFLVFVNKDKLNMNKIYYLGYILIIGSIFYFDYQVKTF